MIYEAHAKGSPKLNPAVPEELRGTYAGLRSPTSMIEYLLDLGVTAVELLPIHQFVSEQRLVKQGLINYWGYNTLNFFTLHAQYASREAQFGGTGAVLREFKGMVKLLHEAGLEVILDVVYNPTSEEGLGGPTTSFRGLDNANYYRQTADGEYIDAYRMRQLGEHLGAGSAAADAWTRCATGRTTCRSTGSASISRATLGRDAEHEFQTDHPLLLEILDDPELTGHQDDRRAMGCGDGRLAGRQLPGDPHRHVARVERRVPRPDPPVLADRHRRPPAALAMHRPASARTRDAWPGRRAVFATERGPLACVNFITAHDGFTLADLTAYDHKHNEGNGEKNRDGTDNNHSFNFGVEGPSADAGHPGCAEQGDAQPARHAAAVRRNADADRRRRVRAEPARQQQRLLPRQRADLDAVGARGLAGGAAAGGART